MVDGKYSEVYFDKLCRNAVWRGRFAITRVVLHVSLVAMIGVWLLVSSSVSYCF